MNSYSSQLVRKLRSERRVSDDTAPLGQSGLRALLQGLVVAVWCCSEASDWYRTISIEPPLLREKEQREGSSVAGDSSEDVAATGAHDALCSLEGSPEPLTARLSPHYLVANEDCLHYHN